jgi:hypothetical protein
MAEQNLENLGTNEILPEGNLPSVPEFSFIPLRRCTTSNESGLIWKRRRDAPSEIWQSFPERFQ